MREILKLPEIAQLHKGFEGKKATLLWISSRACHLCYKFAPEYAQLEQQLGDDYDVCWLTVEKVGGSGACLKALEPYFPRKFTGYPCVYLVEPGKEFHEIPFKPIMWSPALRKFDAPGIAKYIEEYLSPDARARQQRRNR